MTKYFKRPYKHSKSHFSDNSTHHNSTNHYRNSHPDRHKHISCNNNGEVNEIINQTAYPIMYNQNMKIMKNTMTQTVLIAYLIPPQTWNDYHGEKLSKLN